MHPVTFKEILWQSAENFYNLERLMHLIWFKGPWPRAKSIDCFTFKETGFMSQPSTFLATHTSNKIWLKTPCGLTLGKVNELPFRSSSKELPNFTSRLLLELGTQILSLALTSTLLKLSFELSAVSWRLQMDSDILLQELLRFSDPSLNSLLWENIVAALPSNSMTLEW